MNRQFVTVSSQTEKSNYSEWPKYLKYQGRRNWDGTNATCLFNIL